MLTGIKSFFLKRKTKKKMEKKGFTGSRKRKKTEDSIGATVDKSIFLQILLLLFVLVSSVAVLVTPNVTSLKGEYNIGEKAINSKLSETVFEYEDKFQFEKDKKAVAASVPQFYKVDKSIINSFKENIDKLFESIKERKDAEEKEVLFNISGDLLKSIIEDMNEAEFDNIITIYKNVDLRKLIKNKIIAKLEEGIIKSSTRLNLRYGEKIKIFDNKGRISFAPKLLSEIETELEVLEDISNRVTEYYSAEKRDEIKAVIKLFLKPILKSSLVIENDRRKKAVESAIANITKTVITISAGEVLIKQGSILTEEDLFKYKKHEEIKHHKNADNKFMRKVKESIVICLLLMFLTIIYIYHIHPEIVRSNKQIWMIGITIIAMMWLNFAFIALFNKFNYELGLSSDFVSYCIPISITAIVLSVLIGLRVAMYAGLYITILFAILLDKSFDCLLLGLATSCISGYFVRFSMNYRVFFVRIVASVWLSMLLINFAFFKTYQVDSTLWMIGLTFANSIITAMLSLIFIFILESIFRVSTDMTLLTLCDYNHPLLKRLQMEAPGTYHHSLQVSMLAERGAEEIGANAIAARVGALFHDIGKLHKPHYFTENQQDGEKPHDDLNSRMSAMIIASHVKEGVDLAMQYKLRKVIRDAIEQHHGTDLISFFYMKAREESINGIVNEAEYRYNGPLPRSKVVAIISLADACEAATRSISSPNKAKIDTMIWKIFRSRIKDGQLNHANLTFAELAKLQKVFTQTIATMLHGRISYPDEKKEENEDTLFVGQDKISPPKSSTIQRNSK